MEPIILKINHDPVAWTAPRLGRGICYSAHSKYVEIFHAYILSQYKKEPIKAYVALDMVFNVPYPKSASRSKIQAMEAGKLFPTRSDLTNYQKFSEDCLKKIVIEDDRNVVQITSKKLYALTGSVIIKVTPLCE